MRSIDSLRLAALALLLALTAPTTSSAATAPGDVVFRIRPYQKYQYYAFSSDTLQWAAWNEEGSVLGGSSTRDTTQSFGATVASLSFRADSGTFHAQLAASIDEFNRTGAFHLLTNQIEVNVYVRGPAGTPYWLLRREAGVCEASRLGGLPGGLQPVNGTASGRFLDSLAYVPNGGVDSTVVDTAYFLSGVTNATTIIVGGQSYTLARRLTLATPVQTTQAVCILGCMTEAATFHARGAGDVTLEMFLGTNPAEVSDPRAATGLRLAAGPNPFRAEAALAFAAPAGERVRLEVFDLRGRRVATLFDGVGDGAQHRALWRAGSGPGGMYFARLRSGTRESVVRLARLP